MTWLAVLAIALTGALWLADNDALAAGGANFALNCHDGRRKALQV